jgi:hypothetical protein
LAFGWRALSWSSLGESLICFNMVSAASWIRVRADYSI